MAETISESLLDVATSLLLAPVGATIIALRSGLHLLEGAVHVSEAVHAFVHERRATAAEIADRLEVAAALAEVHKLEAQALRSDVARLARERDRAEASDSAKREEIAKLRRACENGDAALRNAYNELAEAQRTLADLSAQRDTLADRCMATAAERDDLSTRLVAQFKEIERLRAELEAARVTIGRRDELLAAYEAELVRLRPIAEAATVIGKGGLDGHA